MNRGYGCMSSASVYEAYAKLCKIRYLCKTIDTQLHEQELSMLPTDCGSAIPTGKRHLLGCLIKLLDTSALIGYRFIQKTTEAQDTILASFSDNDQPDASVTTPSSSKKLKRFSPKLKFCQPAATSKIPKPHTTSASPVLEPSSLPLVHRVPRVSVSSGPRNTNETAHLSSSARCDRLNVTASCKNEQAQTTQRSNNDDQKKELHEDTEPRLRCATRVRSARTFPTCSTSLKCSKSGKRDAAIPPPTKRLCAPVKPGRKKKVLHDAETM